MRKEETGRAASGRTIHNMSWQAAGDSRVLGEINAATVLNAEEAGRVGCRYQRPLRSRDCNFRHPGCKFEGLVSHFSQSGSSPLGPANCLQFHGSRFKLRGSCNTIQEAEAVSAFEHVAKKERDGSAQKYEEKCRACPSPEQDVCHPEPCHTCRGKSIYRKPLKGFF